jgi:PBP1b-binding outer membrane lipoprotein LpoB
MKNIPLLLCILCLIGVICIGCDSQVRIDDTRGRGTLMEDPETRGVIAGVGMESQDIVSVTDKMMRDILATPAITRHSTPPRVVIDSSYFRNESSSIINKNLFTDRLRVELNRAANGRLVFLARHLADMTEKEYELEEQEIVTEGTQGETKQALGYDYRLGGRIASIDMVDPRKGFLSRYHQITFELVERGSGTIVWSGIYEMKKSAQDDIIYR